MAKPLSAYMVAMAVASSVLALGGCPESSVPLTAEDPLQIVPLSPLVPPGDLKVDIGSDRVATPGEVFWLPAQVSGGTLPYTFVWTCPSVARGGTKPLISGGDGPVPCVTVHSTCCLCVTVTDGNGATASARVSITVPQ
jgi:hypothetical protein